NTRSELAHHFVPQEPLTVKFDRSSRRPLSPRPVERFQLHTVWSWHFNSNRIQSDDIELHIWHVVQVKRKFRATGNLQGPGKHLPRCFILSADTNTRSLRV